MDVTHKRSQLKRNHAKSFQLHNSLKKPEVSIIKILPLSNVKVGGG